MRSKAARSKRLPRPTIFLDRDGTLIEEREYLKDPRQIHILRDVPAALRRLQRAGFPMIVVSNQSGVARGLMTRADVEKVNREFSRQLKRRGVRLRGIYWCPHGPHAKCSCRKPRLGLVKRASRELHLPWKNGISIGDKRSDVQLGQRTGGLGLLVLTGYGKLSLKQKGRFKPDFVARTFTQAVDWILKKEY